MIYFFVSLKLKKKNNRFFPILYLFDTFDYFSYPRSPFTQLREQCNYYIINPRAKCQFPVSLLIITERGGRYGPFSETFLEQAVLYDQF
jgi:hypothetical protein